MRYRNAHDGRRTIPIAADDNIIEMRWLLQRELGGIVVFFHEVTIPPGTVEGTHQHIGSEELYYIIRGRGARLHGRRRRSGHRPLPHGRRARSTASARKPCKELPVKPGSVIFTKSGGMHGIRNPGTQPLKFVAFLYHTPERQRRASRQDAAHGHRSQLATCVVRVQPGTSPDYNADNPLLRAAAARRAGAACRRARAYLTEHLQYLFPLEQLELYGPQRWRRRHARSDAAGQQDRLPEAERPRASVARHAARARLGGGGRLDAGRSSASSYRGGPDSRLSEAANHSSAPAIKLLARGGSAATPRAADRAVQRASDRYEIELWGYHGRDLSAPVWDHGARGPRARRADRAARPRARQLADFERDELEDRDVLDSSPRTTRCTRCCRCTSSCAWANREHDGLGLARRRATTSYEFNMVLRGWDNFLGVGISPNPHGGVGFLEYRNLFSNYGRYAGSGELGRRSQPWNFDAFGRKDDSTRARAVHGRRLHGPAHPEARTAASACTATATTRKCS